MIEEKTILNTSGASYIDSPHMAKLLVNDDYCVIILDNLSTGHVEVANFWRLITRAVLMSNNFKSNTFLNPSFLISV